MILFVDTNPGVRLQTLILYNFIPQWQGVMAGGLL